MPSSQACCSNLWINDSWIRQKHQKWYRNICSKIESCYPGFLPLPAAFTASSACHCARCNCAWMLDVSGGLLGQIKVFSIVVHWNATLSIAPSAEPGACTSMQSSTTIAAAHACNPADFVDLIMMLLAVGRSFQLGRLKMGCWSQSAHHIGSQGL